MVNYSPAWLLAVPNQLDLFIPRSGEVYEPTAKTEAQLQPT